MEVIPRAPRLCCCTAAAHGRPRGLYNGLITLPYFREALSRGEHSLSTLVAAPRRRAERLEV